MNSFGNSIKKVVQISVLALSFVGATTFGAAAQNSNSNDNGSNNKAMIKVEDIEWNWSPSVKMDRDMIKKSRVERIFTSGIDYSSDLKAEAAGVKAKIEAFLTKENVRHEVFMAPSSGDKRGMVFTHAVGGTIYGPYSWSEAPQTLKAAVAEFKKKYPDATLGAVTPPSGLTPSSDDGSQLALARE